MVINNDDVKLFESQRLTDKEDGGGRITGKEVHDRDINNLYRGKSEYRAGKASLSKEKDNYWLQLKNIIREPIKLIRPND